MDGVTVRVHLQAPQTQGTAGPLRPPQQGPNAGEQLHHAKGLGHVIVGAAVQPQDLVILGALGGQHNNWNIGMGAYPAAYIEAVHHGKHDIQQNQIGLE